MRGAPWCALGLAVMLAALFATTSNARTIRVLAFNAVPGIAYDVTLDGDAHNAVISTGAGAIDLTVNASSGQTLVFSPGDLQPPSPPLFLSFDPTTSDCARATWLPSGDPTVTGYVLHLGTRSVAKGHAATYDAVFHVTGSSYTVCDLPPGTYYAALRARSYNGLLSAYSEELTISVATVPVFFVAFDATARDGAVLLSWDVIADEGIEGFRVYRRDDGGQEMLLSEPALSASAREHVDDTVEPGVSYEYVVVASGESGSDYRSAPVTVETPGLTLQLHQNTPNPFNPATRVPFTLRATARVTLRIYDIRGALVTTLTDQPLPAGQHTVDWDGRNHDGRRLASGVYVYVLTVDGRSLSRKMTLLK
jgi:hypothetical protein